VFRQLTGLLILSISSAALAADPLEAPCQLDVRSTPLKQTLDVLTARLGIPYVLDSSVTDQDAQTPVRLYADHLNGRQAIRWVTRWAELEAVLAENTFFVAQPDRLPVIWRNPVTLQSADTRSSDKEFWQAARKRQADIQWLDAPLSLVARDISARFGVDIIFHAEILKKQNLIHIQQPEMRLDDLCNVLKRHLDAEIDYLDGAVWVHPGSILAASQPAEVKVDRRIGAALPTPGEFLTRPVVIDRKMADWHTLGDTLSSVNGLNCRVVVPQGVNKPDWDAKGSATDILEAGKLLGQLDFQLKSGGSQKLPVLLIQVRPIGR